uniref:Uncharacterized protein n=1 Tax=Timema poppense TaxID=170557 RepID=A0A7R9DMS6_TIMPO|nr:unnamed protein product [Timema poppensis]
MNSPNKIQQLWEFFLQAEPSSYEKPMMFNQCLRQESSAKMLKSLWLDIFLAEFLTEVKDGKTAEEVLSFWSILVKWSLTRFDH